MWIKEGVDIRGIKPEMVIGCMIVSEIYREMKKWFVITSALDGLHMEKSKHYNGYAMDFRIWKDQFTETERLSLRDRSKDRLGSQFDVVLEKDHLHVEFDPK